MNTKEQINVRIPPDLRAWLNEQKVKNRRSLTSEVVCRLEQSKRQEDACEPQPT